MQQAAASLLPTPLHQRVELTVNPRRRTWAGRTELLVRVPASQASVGLHCFNLHIHAVTVDGVSAEYVLHSYPQEQLPDATVDQLRRGTGAVNSVSEHAYDQYARLMFRQQEPELLITLPQKQQQQVAASASAGDAAAAARGADSGKAGGSGAAASGGAAAAPAASAGAPSPAAPAAPAADNQPPAPRQLRICITFSKPASSSSLDTCLLVRQQCLVANALLRRSRGWFPCVDSPLHVYSPGAPHYLPYTFDLALTVPPSCMAVCSGVLAQQTASLAPRPAAAGAGAGAAAGDVIVARTYEYRVEVPVAPSQLSIAVGPFAAVPYADLLAAAGTPGITLPDGSPAVTVFVLRSSSSGSSNPSAQQQQQQQKRGTAAKTSSSEAAAAAAAAGPVGAAGLACLSASDIRQVADTLKPLGVLLRCYSKLLAGCGLPCAQLQVAVVPDGTMLQPWQAGFGSILLSRSLLVTDSLLLQPRLESATALAAATAQQYFGLLLLPQGPEDDWLLQGLAGWLEGQGLKQLAGSNELQYRRWQERVSLSVIDDGEQLGPLSVLMRPGDRGVTAAWGRTHGTQALEPLAAAGHWKASAVLHMLERRIGRDDLRKVVERLVNAAAVAMRSAAAMPPDAAGAAGGAAAGGGPPAGKATTSGAAAAPAASGQQQQALSGPAAAAGAAPKTPPAAAAGAAAGAAAAAAGLRPGVAERCVSTAKFMRQMGRKDGFKKEAPGFAARWINGTGMPLLTAALSWDTRHSQLLLALRQSGSKAVLRGSLRGADRLVAGAAAAGGAAAVAASASGTCQLKVLVRELDAAEEHCLQVGAGDALSMHQLKVGSRLGEQRRRQQRQAATASARPSSARAHEIDGVSEVELRGVPVLWVQVNPGLEWLSVVTLKQPAHWWSLQLEHSKDVVAQAQAVEGLAAQLGAAAADGGGRTREQALLDEYIATILAGVMRNPGVFCRVRLDAAMALGAASARLPGDKCMRELVAFTRDRLYDPLTGLPRPNCFQDLAEALLTQGLPASLALLRDEQGLTPEPVVELLLEVLSCNDNSGSALDDAHWLAGLVAALGQLRLSCVGDLAKVLCEIDRQLAHEAVVSTHNSVLGVACLQAATSLAVSLQHPAAVHVLDRVAALLQGHCRGGSSSSGAMKSAAYAGLLQVAAAKCEAVIEATLYAASEQQQLLMWQQEQQQQQQEEAFGADAMQQQPPPAMYYTELLQTLPPPQMLLDAVLGRTLELLAQEGCALQRAGILREALLLLGQLEQQGRLTLSPTASLPSIAAAEPSPTSAAAAAAAAAVAGTQRRSREPTPAAAGAGGGGGAAAMDVDAPKADTAAAAAPVAAPGAAAPADVQPSQPVGDAPAAAAAAAATADAGVAVPPAVAVDGGTAAAVAAAPPPAEQPPGDRLVPMQLEPPAATDAAAANGVLHAQQVAVAAAAASWDPSSPAPAATAVSATVMLPLSLEVLLQLHQLMWCHGEPLVRQLAFMLLQKLAAQPTTLYRAREEDEEEEQQLTAVPVHTAGAVTAPGSKQQTAAPGAAGGPAGSEGGVSGRTGGAGGARSGRPAMSGGVSHQTGATTGTKFKLGVRLPRPAAPSATAPTATAAAAPTASTGTAGTAATVGTAAAVTAVPAPPQQQQQQPPMGVVAAAAAAAPDGAQAQQQQQQQQQMVQPAPPVPVQASTHQQAMQPPPPQQQPFTAPPAAAAVDTPSMPPAPAAVAAAAPAAAAAAAAPVAPAAAPASGPSLPKGRKLTQLGKRSTPSAQTPPPAAAAAGVPAGAAPVPAAAAAPPAPVPQQQQQQQQQQMPAPVMAAPSTQTAPSSEASGRLKVKLIMKRPPPPPAAGGQPQPPQQLANAPAAVPAPAAAAAGGQQQLPPSKKMRLGGAPPQQPQAQQQQQPQPAPGAAAVPAAAPAPAPPAAAAPAPSAAPSSAPSASTGTGQRKLKFKMPRAGGGSSAGGSGGGGGG